MPDKQAYVLGAHYFSDCGMGNFWTTFRKSRVRQDFEQIRQDGFTHVLCIVPWALFQPNLDSAELDPRYVERFDFLHEQARSAGLRTVLRPGYLWEMASLPLNTYRRYRRFLVDETVRSAWKRYLADLHAAASRHPNYDFSFLSWEDFFWPIFRDPCEGSPEQRAREPTLPMFRDYLSARLDLDDVNTLYGTTFESWSDVNVPAFSEPLVTAWAHFYDEVVSDRIYLMASAACPGIEFESRIDTNALPSTKGVRSKTWQKIKPGLSRPVTYFHPHGKGAAKASINAAEALTSLNLVLDQYGLTPNMPHKVFVDQFNFVIRNPDYDFFTAIQEDQLPQFIELSAEPLRNKSSGYAVWGYRDWIDDKCFNGAFELGRVGWQGQFEIGSDEDGHHAKLNFGDMIRQRLVQPIRKKVNVLIETSASEDAELEIRSDDTVLERVCISGGGRIRRRIFTENQGCNEIQIACVKGGIILHRIGVFTHVFSSGLYTTDNEERPTVAAIRRLNRALS